MAVSYHISFPDPKNHLARVTITVDTPPAGLTEVWMPVWSPGSYLVREYSRNVQNLEALDAAGEPLKVTKTAKNRWRVETRNTGLTIRYAVYGLEKSVRTNWIDTDYAFLNAPSTFLLVRGTETGPFQVTVEAARGWDQVYCPLVPAQPAPSITYTAPDLDTLLDSPVVCGTPKAHSFEVMDKTVTLVNLGEAGLWDGVRAAQDTQRIVETYGAMYGSLPFDRYLFYNLIVEAGGGLEHKNGSVLMASRYAFRKRETYIKWLGLVSHEFFHVWNVKRSRPRELGPFDYETEVYTRNLWVAEGITAYYTDLMPKRAGLVTEAEYLKHLSAKIDQLQNTPGRALQSLEDSSFDAWIKLYRPDENTINSTVSYYLKGCVVAWLLDVEIRRRTGDAKSLDDLMRALYRDYSGEEGFTREQVQQAAEAIAGEPLGEFFDRYVRGTRELDYSRALAYLGLALNGNDKKTEPWLGMTVETKENRLVVTSVLAGGPGREAGLMPNDELLAYDGFRVTPENREQLTEQFKPGEAVELLVSRTGRLRTLSATWGEAPHPYKLIPDPQADTAAVARRQAWLAS